MCSISYTGFIYNEICNNSQARFSRNAKKIIIKIKFLKVFLLAAFFNKMKYNMQTIVNTIRGIKKITGFMSFIYLIIFRGYFTFSILYFDADCAFCLKSFKDFVTCIMITEETAAATIIIHSFSVMGITFNALLT